jgi:hypothetical protein
MVQFVSAYGAALLGQRRLDALAKGGTAAASGAPA